MVCVLELPENAIPARNICVGKDYKIDQYFHLLPTKTIETPDMQTWHGFIWMKMEP